MPKLACPCGFVHNLSAIPDKGWKTIPDEEYDDFTDAHIRVHEIQKEGRPDNDHPDLAEFRACELKTSSPVGLLYECPECGRLIWRKNKNAEWRVFLLEPDTESDA